MTLVIQMGTDAYTRARPPAFVPLKQVVHELDQRHHVDGVDQTR